MIQYQVNGLIQIKLAAQPLCLISSFFFSFFLSYSLTISISPALWSLPLPASFSLSPLLRTWKKVPKGSLGGGCEHAFSCLIWRTLFFKSASKSCRRLLGMKENLINLTTCSAGWSPVLILMNENQTPKCPRGRNPWSEAWIIVETRRSPGSDDTRGITKWWVAF